MSILGPKPVRIDPDPVAVGVDVSESALNIVLSDGRELSVPLAWFPRLRDATLAQRGNWKPIGRGHGVHWPDVDEDVSVRSLLGLPS